jgi:hypothetical protein
MWNIATPIDTREMAFRMREIIVADCLSTVHIHLTAICFVLVIETSGICLTDMCVIAKHPM